MRTGFQKTIGNFDRLEIRSLGGPGDEWLTLTQSTGDRRDGTITLRSDEAVHDLYYALGRYLEHIKDQG